MTYLIGLLLRWIVNSFGLWLAVQLFGTGHDAPDAAIGSGVFLIAGLIFSVVNMLLKPIVTLISLPAIVLTLGLFTLVINGAMVYISLQLTSGISMTLGHAILASLVIGLVNYAVSGIINMQRIGR